MVKDWPEENAYGEPTEVWIETGKNLSSPVMEITCLNYRKHEGKEWSDILFKSSVFKNKEKT